MSLNFRTATPQDAHLLAPLNARLIKDEGHRNSMTVGELEQRMRAWLGGDYEAVVVERSGEPVGYALYRDDPDFLYLRQLFVLPEARRSGVGRATLNWLRENAGPEIARIRIEVLVGNVAALAFWKSVGFHDYSMTLETDKLL